MVTDWLRPDSAVQYFFLKELLSMKEQIRLKAYQSVVMGFTICEGD